MGELAERPESSESATENAAPYVRPAAMARVPVAMAGVFTSPSDS